MRVSLESPKHLTFESVDVGQCFKMFDDWYLKVQLWREGAHAINAINLIENRVVHVHHNKQVTDICNAVVVKEN